MYHFVIIQVGAGCETFSANKTFMWFFTTMYPLMGIEGTCCAEFFMANRAHMRLFTCFVIIVFRE